MKRLSFLNSVALLLVGAVICSCSSSPAIEVVEKSYNEAEPEVYEISVKFPLFKSKNAKLDAALQPLNDTLSNIVNTEIERFKRVIDLTKEDNEKYRDDPDEIFPIRSWVVYIEDTTFLISKDLISVRLEQYDYAGGAHGVHSLRAFNYNPGTQEFIDMNRLMRKKEPIVNFELMRNFSDPDSLFVLTPTLSENPVINLTETEAVFKYHHYAIGPYSSGMPEVKIPRKNIE